MILHKSFIALFGIVLVQGDPVLGEESKRCYQCSECSKGCEGERPMASRQNEDNERNPEENKSKDDKVSTFQAAIKCCEGSERPLPVCEECSVCPDTGCNKVTGECCSGPEDVFGGCVPCSECDQCSANSKMCCPATKDCPMRKTVGETDYTLSYTGQVAAGCLHTCVYHKDNDTTGRFCFKRGSQPVSYEKGGNNLAINHTIAKKRGWRRWVRFAGDWGSWGSAEFCPDGSFVYGYKIQSEPEEGWDFDDTGLNSISMICRKPGSSRATKNIHSRKGHWGKWSKYYEYCFGYDNPVRGFIVLYESRRISGWPFDDDTTANDIDLFCSDGERISASRYSSWGHWTKNYMCPGGMAVTGMQTRIEEPQGGGDDTALNGLIIYCDYYP